MGVGMDFDFPGVKITDLLNDGPALKAGIKKGDQIVDVRSGHL